MLDVSCKRKTGFMFPLTDITIYDTFDPIVLPDEEARIFNREKMFVCELYHDNLCNYKPPNTSRICLDISSDKVDSNPNYLGSILHSSHYFDKKLFLNLDKLGRYEFLLNYIHHSILVIAAKLNWDKSVFLKAYSEVKSKDYKYFKEYPAKLSPDKKKKGQAILEKTEDMSKWSLRIFGEDIDITTIMIQKTNTYPLDANPSLAKKSKWIDNDKFGFKDLKSEKTIYYNCSTNKRFKNIKFWEEDHENIYVSS